MITKKRVTIEIICFYIFVISYLAHDFYNQLKVLSVMVVVLILLIPLSYAFLYATRMMKINNKKDILLDELFSIRFILFLKIFYGGIAAFLIILLLIMKIS